MPLQVDEVIAQAQSVATNLMEQRRLFDNVTDKLLQVGGLHQESRLQFWQPLTGLDTGTLCQMYLVGVGRTLRPGAKLLHTRHARARGGTHAHIPRYLNTCTAL